MSTHDHRYLHGVWDLYTSIFTPRHNTTCSLGKTNSSYFQRRGPEGQIECFNTRRRQTEIDCFVLMDFVLIPTLGCFYHFCTCQELRSLSLRKLFNVAARKEISTGWFEVTCRKKVLVSCKCGSVSVGGRLYKTTTNVKLHIRENFFCRRLVRKHQLPEQIEEKEERNLFG